MPRALLLFGHPEPESFNGRLASHYARGFTAGGGELERIDLASLRFDPVLRHGYRAAQALEPDLVRVREAIERADHLAWVFPTWWASPPAIVRALVDRLFVPDWAFRYEPGRALPRGLLAPRSARVITTMDSPRWWYTLVLRRPIHRSFGSATLAFCGLRPLAFTTLHGVRELSEARRARWCERVEALALADAGRAAQARAALAAPTQLATRS
jgi:putative NADPH-quinone reductase